MFNLNFKTFFIFLYTILASFIRIFVKIQGYRANLQLEQEYSLIKPYLDALESARQRDIDIVAALSNYKISVNQVDEQIPVTTTSVWHYTDFILPAVVVIAVAVSSYIIFSYYFPPGGGYGGIDGNAAVSAVSSITSTTGKESPAVSVINDNTNNGLPSNWIAKVSTVEVDGTASPSETVTQIILSTDFF